jgi:ATP phosphoribosyltransferase
MTADTINLCLPKGDPMAPLSAHLDSVGFPVEAYHSKNRTYRPPVRGLPVRAKIMAEKDVAIQVSVGNYDIGFCGLDWIKEHLVRYRGTRIQIFRRLPLHAKVLFACTGLKGSLKCVDDLQGQGDFVTIVSEYPNISEHFAIHKRLKKFKIFSAWGSVEGYPPEHADAVIIAVTHEADLEPMGLHAVHRVLDSELCLVVNRNSLVEKDLSPVLQYFSELSKTNGGSDDRNSR